MRPARAPNLNGSYAHSRCCESSPPRLTPAPNIGAIFIISDSRHSVEDRLTKSHYTIQICLKCVISTSHTQALWGQFFLINSSREAHHFCI